MSCIIHQNINVGKWKVILGALPIQVSVIHTHMHLTILLRYQNDISNPLWIRGNSQEIGVELLHDFILDLFRHLGPHTTNLLFHRREIFFCGQMMNHDISIEFRHVFI